MLVSQNAQQALDNNYSYTLYDALGRIKEVGQKPQAANSMNQDKSEDPVELNAWINTTGGTKNQITRTTYDVIATNTDILKGIMKTLCKRLREQDHINVELRKKQGREIKEV